MSKTPKKSSPGKSKHARAVRVIEIDDTGDHFKLNERELKRILHKVPSDLPISIVSVVGAFRTGKSFLLDMMLRYLHFTEGKLDEVRKWNKESEPNQDWILNKPLEGNLNSAESNKLDHMVKNGGFGWRSGKDRCTTGIWMWNEYFIREIPETGEKVAVLLVDTQGMFDSTLGQQLTAAIFGLSTLISSYQIYNLDKRIQEDNLQHLALFTEYGRVALQEQKKREEGNSSAATPFQRLDLLVRDWQNFDDEDGNLSTMSKEMQDYLNEVLDEEKEQKDLKQVREQINECFEIVSCFLLPHPGLDIPKRTYDGDVSKIRKPFLRLLSEYMRNMFSSRLVVKKIHGKAVNSRELFIFMKAYAELFKEASIFPKAQTLLAATSEANNRNAVDQSVKVFRSVMEPIAGANKKFVEEPKLKEQLKVARKTAIEKYQSVATIGPKAEIEDYLKMLESELKIKENEYIETNKLRDPFGFVQAFMIPLIIALASYVIRMFLDFFCTSWSSTCATSSDFLGMIYVTIFSFVLIHLLSTGHGAQQRIKKLFTLAVEASKN